MEIWRRARRVGKCREVLGIHVLCEKVVVIVE